MTVLLLLLFFTFIRSGTLKITWKVVKKFTSKNRATYCFNYERNLESSFIHWLPKSYPLLNPRRSKTEQWSVLNPKVISGVHVLLVSLLVDQMSGLFLIFFGRPKKNCPVPGNFGSVSVNFWYTKKKFGWPKIPRAWPKIPWDWTIFFLVDQKKWEKDWTIGRPRDWPKPHFHKRLDKYVFKRVNKKDLRLDKFFLVDQKKWEIDRTIGRPRDWPKPHGRD